MPWESLADDLAPFLPAGTNVYSALTNQVAAPALVIRPDEPWLEPSTFCDTLSHWVAVAVSRASTPEEATKELWNLILAVLLNLPEGWSFATVGSVAIDQSTGTAFLTAPIRLTFPYSHVEVS